MALTNKNGICDFGWKARDFALKGVDGKTYTLADVRGSKGTLVDCSMPIPYPPKEHPTAPVVPRVMPPRLRRRRDRFARRFPPPSSQHRLKGDRNA